MKYVILVFGGAIAAAGITIAIRPKILFYLLRSSADTISLYVAAIVVRLLLGIVLLSYADSSKFPMAFHVLGWIAIIAALILLMIGRKRFARMTEWIISRATPFAPVAGIAAFLFGGFLIYSVA